MVPGLYWHRITEAAGRHFFEDTWKVAPEADRIGYRFKGGRPLEFVPRTPPFGAGSDPSNIVDACYPYGSIQVPGGTEPIVLHRDAVSGGGYFMVGTVISADMDLIGQLQPHTPAKFVEVDLEGALKARRDREACSTKCGLRCRDHSHRIGAWQSDEAQAQAKGRSDHPVRGARRARDDAARDDAVAGEDRPLQRVQPGA